MKNTLLFLLILAAVQVAAGQKTRPVLTDERKEIQKELSEIKKEQQSPVNALLTVADVGEPDSFGRNAKFLGTAATGTVYVYRSCDPAILLAELDVTLGANDRCLAHTPGGPGSSATFTDIGRITIPGRTADNVIYFITNNVISNTFDSSISSNPLFAFFLYSPRLTIESTALNDPTAVDPVTGQPLNGVLTVSASSAKFFSRMIAANGFEDSVDFYSSAATRGLARSYFADLGLPQNVINQLYRQPMTIKLGLRVSVRGLALGGYSYSVRFLGN